MLSEKKRKLFTAIAALLILFAVLNNRSIRTGDVPQTEQSAEENGENTNKSQEDEKNTQYYLKRLKIGKSNIAAFIILGGVLIGIQIKRSHDEKQKDSR